MAHDLVIKNGTIVDGTGLPRYRADIGIRDGKIVEKGKIDGGSKVIDAEGRIVAPGFIDIHTHYDAQVLWDPLVTSSPWHGFTTVVIGNCGFTIAPCKPEDRDYITGMLARVEGMNKKSIEAGVDWSWQSFGEYLDRLDRQPLGVNVATMVGHSGVRRFVMGPEASTKEATDAEIAQMKQQVRESLAAGAFGFSTSRGATHHDGDGAPVPSRQASDEELLELAGTLKEFNRGSVEVVGVAPELMTQISLTTGRPLNWNELSHGWDQPDAWKGQLASMEQAAERGAQVYAVARCFRLDQLFGLNNPRTLQRYGRWPQWDQVLAEPRERRVQLLRSPDVRARLKDDVEKIDATKPAALRLPRVVFFRSGRGKYTEFEGLSLDEISHKTGKDPVDIVLDWSLEEDLESEFAFIGTRNGDPEAVAQILKSPFCVPGISDAGASISSFNGTYFSTCLLAEWVRDKAALPLEDAVRRLTFLPSALYGIHDRGTIREGMKADVVIFDLDRLAWLPAERLEDFPAGQSRLVTRAEGYDYVIVNGRVAFEDGHYTGAASGQLLRSTAYNQGG